MVRTSHPVLWPVVAIVAIGILGDRALTRSAIRADVPLFEGDILGYTPDLRAEGALANAVTDRSYLWPDGIVPYEISNAYSSTQKGTITSAMQDMEQKTCIRFRTKEPSDTHSIIVDNYQPRVCYAYWGRQPHEKLRSINSQLGYPGLQQLVNIAVGGCLTQGIIQHELLHTIGFLHEQARKDRDSYVEIFWDNIEPAQHGQFNKHLNTDAQGQPYDFNSVMHYGRKDFSKNWQDTIRPKAPYEEHTIGQRRGMSEIDIKKVNTLYRCPSGGEEPVTPKPFVPFITSPPEPFVPFITSPPEPFVPFITPPPPMVVRTTASPSSEECEYRFMCVTGICGNFRVCTIGGKVEATTEPSYRVAHCHKIMQCNGVFCSTSYVCH